MTTNKDVKPEGRNLSLEGKFSLIKDALVELGAVKDWDTANWETPSAQAGIYDFLSKEGVSLSDITHAVASALGREVYDSDKHGEADLRGPGWLLAAHTLWVSSPFDSTLTEQLSRRSSGQIHFENYGLFIGSGAPADTEEARDTELDAIFNEIVEAALEKGASDIHISVRTSTTVSVLFRVDGERKSFQHRINIKDYGAFSNRALNRSGNYGGEINKPISAKITHNWKGRESQIRMEVRPATVTSSGRPYFVLRLLSSGGSTRSLEDVNFPPHHYKMLNGLCNRTKGLFLVTGPTGSGKTTTLYALLQKIREIRPGDSIQTLEDPVEVEIPGIEQTSINDGAGMTFQEGIRSALRSDPDVILVGEIRDNETAQQAVVASETGHLVLATLHTNSAAATISRLLSFDLDRVTLANALIAISAQRMVRLVCSECSSKVPFGEVPYYRENYTGLKSSPKLTDMVRVASKEGCKSCTEGYTGRSVVSEVMMVDPNTEKLILASATASEIEKAHVSFGFEPLWGHGISLVRDGLTTIEELESKLEPLNSYGDNFDYNDYIEKLSEIS